MRGRPSVASMRLRGFGTRPATAVFAAIGLVLAACGSTGPPLKTYVLGAPQIADGAADPLLGRPVIEVKRALMPDYLDGTEILVRGPGNLVEASRTGRWRERLSVGATRAIANGPWSRPARRRSQPRVNCCSTWRLSKQTRANACCSSVNGACWPVPPTRSRASEYLSMSPSPVPVTKRSSRR